MRADERRKYLKMLERTTKRHDDIAAEIREDLKKWQDRCYGAELKNEELQEKIKWLNKMVSRLEEHEMARFRTYKVLVKTLDRYKAKVGRLERILQTYKERSDD